MWTSSSLTFTVLLLLRVVIWSFFLKECCATLLSTIPFSIFSTACWAQSALTGPSSSMPVTMVLRLGFSSKGFLGTRNPAMLLCLLCPSSVSVLKCTCLYAVHLLCTKQSWVPAWQNSPGAQAGDDRSQTSCWVSFIPHPLVSPPVVLILLINTCSGESPDQYRSLLLITWSPCRKCWYTSVCDVLSMSIFWRYRWRDLV